MKSTRCCAGLGLAFACLLSRAASAQEIELRGPIGGEPTLGPKPNDDFRFDIGAIAPAVAVMTRLPSEAVVGAGVIASISGRLARPFWVVAEVFGKILGNDNERVALVGGSLIGRWQASQSLAFGVGFSAGGLSDDGDPLLKPAPFFGPLVVPISVWFEGLHLEGRIPLTFSQVRERGVWATRSAMVGIELAVTFGITVAPETKRPAFR